MVVIALKIARILQKLFYGNFVLEPLGAIFLKTFVRAHQHQVELGVVRQEQLAAHEVAQLQKYTWPSTRTNIQLILQSLGGEVHDGQIAPQLIERVGDAGFLIADKGYDSEAIREIARNHNMQPVIPKNRIVPKKIQSLTVIYIDYAIWSKMHLLAFARLKHFRCIAT